MKNHIADRRLGPMLKLQRAVHFQEELEFTFRAYGSRVVETWQDIEDEPDNVELRFSEKPPATIPLIIGDIVHNLRSSLDLAVNLIASKLDPSLDIDKSRLDFPFADTETEHKKQVRKKFLTLDPDFHDYLVSSRAFKGGNSLLYGLHQLDILDKHRYIMPVIAITRGKSANQLFQEQFPEIKVQFITIGEEENIFSSPSINREGLKVSRIEAEKISLADLRSGLPPTAIFPKNTPFEHQHVTPVIEKLVKTTDDVLCHMVEHFLF